MNNHVFYTATELEDRLIVSKLSFVGQSGTFKGKLGICSNYNNFVGTFQGALFLKPDCTNEKHTPKGPVLLVYYNSKALGWVVPTRLKTKSHIFVLKLKTSLTQDH